MIKIAAFLDELEKLGAAPVGLAKTFLTKYIPKIIGSKAGQGVLSSTGRFLSRHAKSSLTAGEILSKGMTRAAKRWGPYASGVKEVIQSAPGKGPILKSEGRIASSALGKKILKPRAPHGKIQKMNKIVSPQFFKDPVGALKAMPKNWAGDIATQYNTIAQKGWKHAIKEDIQRGRFMQSGGYHYKKRLPGRAMGTLWSAPGLFALSAKGPLTQEKDYKGRPYTPARRAAGVARAGAMAAGWATSPRMMSAVMIPTLAGSMLKRKKTDNIEQQF